MTTAAVSSEPPNIVLILADDLGYADLGCHGSDDIRTPNIDALALGGIRFAEGYVPSSVCGPSRASLMTGQYSCEFGVHGNGDSEIGIPHDIKNIAEYLNEGADYYSAILGKWHLGHSESQTPMARGFNHFLGFLNGRSNYFPFSDGGVKWMETRGDPRPQRNEQSLQFGDYPPETYMTDWLTQEAVEIIQGQHGRAESQPFFIFLSYNAPHGPLQATKESLQRNLHVADKKRRTFAGMMTSLDDGVGRVVQTLKEEGVYKNTLVVFLSDNGGPTEVNTSKNTPFRGTKGMVWEGGVRVPFILSWPGRIAEGQLRDEPVSSLDLAPTFVSLAGQTPDPSFDGIDLSDWLLDSAQSLPARDFYYWKGSRSGVRSGDYKYTVHGETLELFNIRDNPSENPDKVLKNPERSATLAEQLVQWESTWPESLQNRLESGDGEGSTTP